MAYQNLGGEMADATGYDVAVLLKHSRRHVTVTATAATMVAQGNGGLRAGGVESRGEMRLVSSTANFSNSGISSSFKAGGKSGSPLAIEDKRLRAWIRSRVRKADKDLSFFPTDDMESLRYEGKYWDFDDLSELEFDEDVNKGSEVWSIDWDRLIESK